MPKMLEVVIDSVRVSLTNQQRIVVLREVDTDRYLPIWIGPYEAEAITYALQEVEVARPLTHDLLKNMLHALNGKLVRVEVVSLREDVFYGNLLVETNGRTIEIDSRPSDALALAVRAHVPILVAKEVMDAAGITPEQETQEAEASTQSSAAAAGTPSDPEASVGRLSVFEDFLDKFNLDDLNSPSEPTDDTDQDEDDNLKSI
jgi:bifunctional DNase/RNase